MAVTREHPADGRDRDERVAEVHERVDEVPLVEAVSVKILRALRDNTQTGHSLDHSPS
jgi:hypothetical protein